MLTFALGFLCGMFFLAAIFLFLRWVGKKMHETDYI